MKNPCSACGRPGSLARIEDSVQADALGEFTLKGFAQQVAVFNVTGFKNS